MPRLATTDIYPIEEDNDLLVRSSTDRYIRLYPLSTTLCHIDTCDIVQQFLDTSRRGLCDLACRDECNQTCSFVERCSSLRSCDSNTSQLLVWLTEVTLRGRGSYILRTDRRSVGTRQSQAGECPDVDDTVHRVKRTIVLARQTPKA